VGESFLFFQKSKDDMHCSYIRATPWYFFHNFSTKIEGGEANKLLWRKNKNNYRPELQAVLGLSDCKHDICPWGP
jgi:hypothetical protein